MPKTLYVRKGKTITHIETGQTLPKLNSINAAKRKSREIQMDEDGALGRGTLRLIKIS